MVMSFLKANAGGNLDNLSPRKSCVMNVVTIEHYTIQKEHNECSFSITDKYIVELWKTSKCVENIVLHRVIHGYSVLMHINKTNHIK